MLGCGKQFQNQRAGGFGARPGTWGVSQTVFTKKKPSREQGQNPAWFWSFISLHVEATEATNAVSKSAKQEQQNEV